MSFEGHVITNNHVVEGCIELLIPLRELLQGTGVGGGTKLESSRQVLDVLSIGRLNDLALLGALPKSRNFAKFRAGRGVRTGEEVMVAGFPLHGFFLASDLNVTKGTVSALAGPGNDRRVIQIRAPVPPGSSSGPETDSTGKSLASWLVSRTV